MKPLKRNQRPYRCALYLGKEEILVDGKRTGEWRLLYSEPIDAKANISAGRGETTAQPFGTSVEYDRILIPNDEPLDENSLLWIDRLDGEHDYIVTKVADSLNGRQVAVKKVDVS